jgi:hypothetical protein
LPNGNASDAGTNACSNPDAADSGSDSVSDYRRAGHNKRLRLHANVDSNRIPYMQHLLLQSQRLLT